MGSAHLKPRDIKYLALEGGGGKGFAYLGALQMLENNPDAAKVNILQQVQGVAGTSAGAITALLISLGMTAKDIENEMQNPTGLKDFNDFFDPASPRLIPKPIMRIDDSYGQRDDNPLEKAYLRALGPSNPDDLLKLASQLQSWASQLQPLGPSFLPGFIPGWLLNVGSIGTMQWLSNASSGEEQLADRVSKLYPPFSNILADLRYFAYLIRDMGFFCGLAARTYFDNLIAKRCAKVLGKKPSEYKTYKNLTFLAHHKVFGPDHSGKPGPGKDLLVCGANFSTGTSQPFSYRPEHTPDFPVADAVRISMSLPLVYKPYVITKKTKKWPPCGTYIDGGVWNNLPFREVDPTKQVRNTLALRLTIDPPKCVTDAYDLIGVMLGGAISTGESQVLPEFQNLTMTLDTRDLSLLRFQPDDKTKKKVTMRSRRLASRYFGWPIDKADEDRPDDEETKKLQAMTACPCKWDAGP